MNYLYDCEYIRERRFQAALERFKDYVEEMEIPLVEEKRMDVCIWMKLKEEIITHRFVCRI